MKKLTAIALCLCLMLSLMAGCGGSKIEYYEEDVQEETAASAETAAAPAETAAAPVETAIGKGGTGFETYPADTVVGTVNGHEMTWMEYYYWLNYAVRYYLQLASQVGVPLTSWDASEIVPEMTNAEYVLNDAQNGAIQDIAVLTAAAERGITLTDEQRGQIDAVFDQNADSIMGDGDGDCTEEEQASFEEFLAQQNVDHAFFDYLTELDIISNAMFVAEYGEQGVNYPAEDTLAFAEENGMMAAKHILLLTVDPETREPLGEEEIAGKREKADALLAQLQAVGDDTEARIALFDQLMAENTEDTGYEHYPDGYVFTSGQMVSAFEEAVKALENEYDISGVVESEYGYHIVMRIPIDPDFVTGTSSGGVDITLRQTAASQQFSAELNALMNAATVVWNDGFERPDMAAIFG